jgi:cell division protein FtsB
MNAAEYRRELRAVLARIQQQIAAAEEIDDDPESQAKHLAKLRQTIDDIERKIDKANYEEN